MKLTFDHSNWRKYLRSLKMLYKSHERSKIFIGYRVMNNLKYLHKYYRKDGDSNLL